MVLFLQIGAHEQTLLIISRNNFMAFPDVNNFKFCFPITSFNLRIGHTICQPGGNTVGKIKLHLQLMTTINIKLGAVKFLFSRNNTHITNLTDHFQLY